MVHASNGTDVWKFRDHVIPNCAPNAIAGRPKLAQYRRRAEAAVLRAPLHERFRGDIDPRVKAKVVVFLYGIETSWLLDPSVPVAGVFAQYTWSLVTALQPFPPNAPSDSPRQVICPPF